MAERNETLTTDRSIDEALKAGTETLQSLGLTITETGPGSLQAKAGSMLMAYWIGLFLPDSSMPVKVRFTVTESGGSRTIEMHTKSSVPLALYVWKFKKRANDIADALTQGVASKLGAGAAQPVS